MINDSKVQKIIETYSKMIDVMQNNLPEGVQVCFALNVVDTNEKDEDYPDGYGEHLIRHKTTPYRKAFFIELVRESFKITSDWE